MIRPILVLGDILFVIHCRSGTTNMKLASAVSSGADRGAQLMNILTTFRTKVMKLLSYHDNILIGSFLCKPSDAMRNFKHSSSLIFCTTSNLRKCLLFVLSAYFFSSWRLFKNELRNVNDSKSDGRPPKESELK